MKEYIIQFKPFLLFLVKFFITYLLLTVIYQSYLGQFDAKSNEIDGFTKIVANQSEKVLSLFDNKTYMALSKSEPSFKVFYQKKWVARIIEGCNALSVIILFISFVIAFTGRLKQTFLFIVIGSLIIHVFNVFRIALLCVLIYKFPNSEPILHGVIFPLIIYGTVFILWVIWVNKFSFYAEKSIKE